jgi:hypothetical protein
VRLRRLLLGAALLTLAATGRAEGRLLAIVDELRTARESGDASAAARLTTPEPRIWFESVEGPGAPWSPVGGGPWAEWDRFFRSRTEVVHAEEDERSVRVLQRETNDWYRLVERPPSLYFVTWYFDPRGRLEGLLIHGLPDEERGAREDLLPEFEGWARREEPGLLDELMPGGRLDPSPPRPELWKRWLLRWREATGRPPVLDAR